MVDGLAKERIFKLNKILVHNCPLCDSLGDDLIFAFYCSNKDCRNYHM